MPIINTYRKVKFTKINRTFETFFIEEIYKVLQLISKTFNYIFKKFPIENTKFPFVGNFSGLRTFDQSYFHFVLEKSIYDKFFNGVKLRPYTMMTPFKIESSNQVNMAYLLFFLKQFVASVLFTVEKIINRRQKFTLVFNG